MQQEPTEYNVAVTLDTSASPPVTVDPADLGVDPGKAKVKWQPASGQADEWAFEWVRRPDKTSDLPDPPFSNTKVEAQEIEIEDDNEDGAYAGTYDYAISVTKDGVSYNTDPRITNRP